MHEHGNGNSKGLHTGWLLLRPRWVLLVLPLKGRNYCCAFLQRRQLRNGGDQSAGLGSVGDQKRLELDLGCKVPECVLVTIPAISKIKYYGFARSCFSHQTDKSWCRYTTVYSKVSCIILVHSLSSAYGFELEWTTFCRESVSLQLLRIHTLLKIRSPHKSLLLCVSPVSLLLRTF